MMKMMMSEVLDDESGQFIRRRHDERTENNPPPPPPPPQEMDSSSSEKNHDFYMKIMKELMENLVNDPENGSKIQCNLIDGTCFGGGIFLEVYELDAVANCQFPFFLPEIRVILGFSTTPNNSYRIRIAILTSDNTLIKSNEISFNQEKFFEEMTSVIYNSLYINKYSFCRGIEEDRLFSSIADLSISDFYLIFVDKSGLIRSRNCVYQTLNEKDDSTSLCVNCSNLFADVFCMDHIASSSPFSFTCPICQENLCLPSVIRSHMKSHHKFHLNNDDINLVKKEFDLCDDDYNDKDINNQLMPHSEKDSRTFNKTRSSSSDNKIKNCPTPKLRKKRTWECRKEIGFNICPICSQEFANNARLINHCKDSHDPKGVECHFTECRVRLKWQSYYPHIRLVHSGQSLRTHMCESCGASYKTKTDLTRHMARHRPDKPYKCKHCSKSFYAIESWRRCQRICSGEGDRFMCDKCSKTFFTKSKLAKHIKIHLGIKQFLCPICNYSTYSRNNLKQHTTKVHKLSIEECEHKTGLSHIGGVPLNRD